MGSSPHRLPAGGPAVLAVRQAVRSQLRDVAPGPLLVAVSGGADSMALAAGAIAEAPVRGWVVVGVTVDHGLQSESPSQAARVVSELAALGVHETLTATVTVDAPGIGLEAAAREARYAALDQAAEHVGAPVILLGHTLNDQAETVLLGLARGSGGRSIAGMRRRFGRYRRPLLDLTRETTVAACNEWGITPWQDPHNVDPRFLRARVRHDVLPMLEQTLGPGVAVTLAKTADLLREDMEALDVMAETALLEAEVEGRWRVQSFRLQPLAIASRMVRLAALRHGARGGELAHVHVQALVALVTGERSDIEVQLPGHVTAYRDAAWLQFRRTDVAG